MNSRLLFITSFLLGNVFSTQVFSKETCRYQVYKNNPRMVEFQLSEHVIYFNFHQHVREEYNVFYEYITAKDFQDVDRNRKFAKYIKLLVEEKESLFENYQQDINDLNGLVGQDSDITYWSQEGSAQMLDHKRFAYAQYSGLFEQFMSFDAEEVPFVRELVAFFMGKYFVSDAFFGETKLISLESHQNFVEGNAFEDQYRKSLQSIVDYYNANQGPLDRDRKIHQQIVELTNLTHDVYVEHWNTENGIFDEDILKMKNQIKVYRQKSHPQFYDLFLVHLDGAKKFAQIQDKRDSEIASKLSNVDGSTIVVIGRSHRESILPKLEKICLDSILKK